MKVGLFKVILKDQEERYLVAKDIQDAANFDTREIESIIELPLKISSDALSEFLKEYEAVVNIDNAN